MALSCFTAIINSIYLIFFLNSESVNSSYLNDANSFQSAINGSFLNDTFQNLTENATIKIGATSSESPTGPQHNQ